MVNKIISMRKMTFWCFIWVLSVVGIFVGVYLTHNRWLTIFMPLTFIFPAIGSARQWNSDFKNGSYSKKKLMIKELKHH